MNTHEQAATVARLRAVADAIEAGTLLEANITVDTSTAPTSEARRGKVVAVNVRLRYVGRKA